MKDRRIQRVVVAGLGRFGQAIALALADLGVDVIALDTDPRAVEAVKEHVGLAAEADATLRSVLVDLEADKADAIIIGVGESFEANVLVTAMAAELGIAAVITRARSSRQKTILEKVGATRVLYPEQDAGRRLANSMVYGDAIEFVNLPDDHSLRDLPLPARFAGKTLGELGLRRRQGLTVIAVTRRGIPGGPRQVVPVPGGDFRFEAGDVLSVIASNEAFTKLS